MKFVKALRIIVLATFFFVWFSNSANANILWSKELSGANTNSAPLASCLNKDGKGIIVMTRECPKGEHPVFGGDLALWEIEIDGSATRTIPKDANGNQIWTNSYPAGVGPGCAIAKDRLGNLLTTGVLSKEKGEERQKVAVISKADKVGKIISPRNSIETHSIIKMIPLQDNTFVLIGDRNSDGLCLRIDNQGSVLQEKLFDTGQIDIFSGIDLTKSDDSNSALAIASISFGMMSKNPNENLSKDSIFICDANFKTIYEDHFTGGISHLLFPKVCCLDNGNIAVLYKKESADLNKTFLWVRCYTNELKLLWDKEIFITDREPFAMDITARESGGFTVGIIQHIVQQSNSLELCSFDDKGNKIDQIKHKGIVSIGGFNLIRVPGKTIAVFQEGTAGNIKECSIKAKVIALD
jgi:hypothetical protein